MDEGSKETTEQKDSPESTESPESSETTNTPDQPDEELPEGDTDEGGGGGGGGSSYLDDEDEEPQTDWAKVADTFINRFVGKQPTHTTLHLDSYDIRIVHSATAGELLVSFAVFTAIAVFLLRWAFKIIWSGR
ncbi:hypothetical protein C4A76_25395 [Brevibacillus laterosporus]|uniref:hypothetical protein n=1 Tax=Brevibacillus laterosporus TaxID=1465 RepID=UPI000CE44659|nr:hypothetical protein [Brevibacillus laterosporus]PPA80779.1 hypothetical protein C4A76_25395 [Brevibacillus laterosporus]